MLLEEPLDQPVLAWIPLGAYDKSGHLGFACCVDGMNEGKGTCMASVQ